MAAIRINDQDEPEPMSARPGTTIAFPDARAIRVTTRDEAEALRDAAAWVAANWQEDLAP